MNNIKLCMKFFLGIEGIEREEDKIRFGDIDKMINICNRGMNKYRV